MEYIFLLNSYVESVSENSKMNRNVSKVFIVILRLYLKYVTYNFFLVLYNIMEILKIISFSYVINLSNFNTKH